MTDPTNCCPNTACPGNFVPSSEMGKSQFRTDDTERFIMGLTKRKMMCKVCGAIWKTEETMTQMIHVPGSAQQDLFNSEKGDK